MAYNWNLYQIVWRTTGVLDSITNLWRTTGISTKTNYGVQLKSLTNLWRRTGIYMYQIVWRTTGICNNFWRITEISNEFMACNRNL